MIPTFGGLFSYVWVFRYSYGWGSVFVGLMVRDSYLWGFVFLTFGG